MQSQCLCNPIFCHNPVKQKAFGWVWSQPADEPIPLQDIKLKLILISVCVCVSVWNQREKIPHLGLIHYYIQQVVQVQDTEIS